MTCHASIGRSTIAEARPGQSFPQDNYGGSNGGYKTLPHRRPFLTEQCRRRASRHSLIAGILVIVAIILIGLSLQGCTTIKHDDGHVEKVIDWQKACTGVKLFDATAAKYQTVLNSSTSPSEKELAAKIGDMRTKFWIARDLICAAAAGNGNASDVSNALNLSLAIADSLAANAPEEYRLEAVTAIALLRGTLMLAGVLVDEGPPTAVPEQPIAFGPFSPASS